MIRKITYMVMLLTSLITLISCVDPIEENQDIILPVLTGMNQEQALDILSSYDLEVSIVEVINNTIKVGRFVSYGQDLEAGMVVEPDVKITLYFVKQANVLPELTGLDQSEIAALLENLNLEVLYEFINTNDITEDTFVSYADDLSSGDLVDLGYELTVYLASSFEVSILLPNLTGLTEDEIYESLLDIEVDVDILYVENNALADGIFISYGGELEAGDVVEKGQAVLVYVAKHVNMLPDLTGLNQIQIVSQFSDLDVIVEFQTLFTNDVDEDLFVSYGSGFESGDIVKENAVVIVYLAKPIVVVNRGLMISKYLEGSLFNRAIELYNTTQDVIDLSLYHISLYLDGSTEVSATIELQGQILPYQTYVISYAYSQAHILAEADMTTPLLVINGNDTIALVYHNGALVDIVGVIGWGLFYLDDRTLVRKDTQLVPSAIFDISQWDQYIKDYIDIFGNHPIEYPTTFTFDPQFLNIPFDQKGGMIQVEFYSNNDGDTAQFLPDFLGENRVRFVGIDTPETGSGVVAENATKFVYARLSSATTIYLQHDPSSGTTETHGRTLALIWADGVLLNYEIVLRGYSQNNYQDATHALVFNGVSLSTWMTNAELYAKENRFGVWA